MASKRIVRRVALLGWPVAPDRVLAFHLAVQERRRRGDSAWEIVVGAESSVESLGCLHQLRCDGALVRLTSREMADAIKSIDCPVVNVSSWLCDPGVPTVIFDERARGELAAEHLLEKGFQQFLIAAVPGGWFIEERTRGFRERVASAGYRCKLMQLQTLEPSARAYDRMVADMRGLESPTGLFCTDDPAAPLLMQACRDAGWKLPHDIAVVGAVDREDICLTCVPNVSSVGPDENAIAEIAVARLEELMSGKSQVHETILFKPRGVIARDSTDTYAVNDPLVSEAIAMMRNQMSERIDVADVVRQFALARITLERRFRKTLGKTPGDILTELRIRRAEKLLLDQNWTLQQIAAECGFVDRNRFRLVFKRILGVSPRTYRRQHAVTPAESVPGPPVDSKTG